MTVSYHLLQSNYGTVLTDDRQHLKFSQQNFPSSAHSNNKHVQDRPGLVQPKQLKRVGVITFSDSNS